MESGRGSGVKPRSGATGQGNVCVLRAEVSDLEALPQRLSDSAINLPRTRHAGHGLGELSLVVVCEAKTQEGQ